MDTNRRDVSCVHVFVRGHTGVWVHVCSCIWRSEPTLGVVPQDLPALLIEIGCLTHEAG